MNEEKKTGNRGRILYLILIFLLLGMNGWLFYNAVQNKTEREENARLLEEAKIANKLLDEQYQTAKQQLTDQKGDFSEKDSLIAVLEAELDNRRNEIATLLKTCNFFNGNAKTNEKKIDEVKEEVKTMEVDCSQYKAQLDELNARYLALQEDYEELQFLYDQEVGRSEQLQYDKDSILDLAGFILSKDITITGIRKRGNGNDAEGQNAKHTEMLKICFDVLPNRLSAGKDQTFLVRIIAPNGKVLFDTKNGSGEFVNKEKTEDNLYSMAATYKYDGYEVESHCVYWEQDEEFKAGTYTVKLYHNGYLSSRSSFTLKKAVMEDLMSKMN